MKKVIQKAAAAVMAFTILGTGTAFTDAVTAKSEPFTACAATVSPNTPHNHGYATYSRHESNIMSVNTKVKTIFGIKVTIERNIYYYEWDVVRCSACNGVISKKLDYDKSFYETIYYDYSGKPTYVSKKKKIPR